LNHKPWLDVSTIAANVADKLARSRFSLNSDQKWSFNNTPLQVIGETNH